MKTITDLILNEASKAKEIQWRIDGGTGGIGGASAKLATLVKVGSDATFVQIHPDSSSIDFLNDNDIATVDEVNEQNGKLKDAVYDLHVGQSYITDDYIYVRIK